MMEVFVIKDGVKQGPFQVFELKTRVDAGDFTADDLGWTKGMDGWKPLGEIEALDWIVAKPEVEPPPLPTDGGELLEVRPWVRYWARIVDWHLMRVLISLVAYPFGGFRDGGTALGVMSIAFGWGLIEAVILSRWGTTPGKWLLGVRVERDEEGGGVPEMGSAVKRSLLMVMFGYGMGLAPLTQMAWVISFFRLRQWRRTLWDEQTGLRVVHSEVTQQMVVRTVAVLLVSMALITWLNWDYILELSEQVRKDIDAAARGEP